MIFMMILLSADKSDRGERRMMLKKAFRNMMLVGAALLLLAPPTLARVSPGEGGSATTVAKSKKAKASAKKRGVKLAKKKVAKVTASAKKRGVKLAKKKVAKVTASAKKRGARLAKKMAAKPTVVASKNTPQYAKTVSCSGSAQDAAYLRDQLTSRSAVVMDAATGDMLYAQNPDLPGQPASTIKVLTGLIALKSLRNDDLVPASREAARMPRSKIYLRPGKKYVADDLINAVLLASANDASVALAERIAGTERAFAKLMTKKAEALGATNTVCVTANGLTAPGQQTTAHDLAMIFRHAMRDEEFCRRMAFTAVKTSDGKLLRSHNKALWQIEGAEGGKTGYTDVARKTYVGKFSRDGHELIVAIMGSESMWTDIRHLVEFGFQTKMHGMTVAGRNGHEERRHSTLRAAEARIVSNL